MNGRNSQAASSHKGFAEKSTSDFFVKPACTNRRAVAMTLALALNISACTTLFQPQPPLPQLPKLVPYEHRAEPHTTNTTIDAPSLTPLTEKHDPAPGTGENSSVSVSEKGVKLDFDEAELTEFVQVVAESLGLNYTMDPSITGKITVHTGQTLSGPKLYAAFREILTTQGLGIRTEGPLSVIYPVKGAKHRYDLNGLHVRLLPIEHAPVSVLTAELKQAMASFDPQSEAVTLVPLEQIQSVMILTPDGQIADTLTKWTHDLDTISADARQGLYLYNVRCGLASDLTKLVNSLLYTITSPQAPAPQPQPQAQPQNQSQPQPQQPPQPIASTNTAPATLIADDSRNVILINATTQEHARIVKVLEQLDITPRQVLIDVLVAEVSLGDSLALGIEWALKNNQLTIGNSAFSLAGGPNFDQVKPNAIGGLTYTIFNAVSDPVAVLNALAAKTDVTLVSSPQIFVENNQQAMVNVGDRVPVVTSETNQVNAATPTVDRQVQYFDTGTILRVTPRINFDGMVGMEVNQQVSQATANQTSSINSPVISTREIKTRLSVRDGQPIMLGGLISRGHTNTANKVPLLGDLPGLGFLFRFNGTEQKRTELLVMITPHVVYADDLDAFQANYRPMAKELSSRLGKPSTK
jgi:type II secretion system protein D